MTTDIRPRSDRGRRACNPHAFPATPGRPFVRSFDFLRSIRFLRILHVFQRTRLGRVLRYAFGQPNRGANGQEAKDSKKTIPDVPTLKELGYDYAQTSWRTIVVNKDTPDEIVEQLARTLKRVAESEAVRKSAEENWEPMAWMGPKETTAFLQKELGFYEELTKSLGIHWSQKVVK